MTVIDTSTASTATAYSNQRKVDHCQNGVLWTIRNGIGASGAVPYYSLDNGSTWTFPGNAVPNGSGSTATTYTTNASFFIDLDDYAHVVFKDNSNGYIYYRRGTPNAARTAWTWSSAESIFPSTRDINYPDIVAHREGTGWKAWVTFSYREDGGTISRVMVYPISITSGGDITVESRAFLSPDYGTGNSTYPSIDFNHTGDGKTVAGSTPHLYVAWSAGATGSGKGIRFKKATYSGGSWTWGTEREIDSTRFINSPAGHWLNCLFDGTRVALVGQVSDGSNQDVVLHERNAADTSTTTRVLIDNAAGGAQFIFGTSTYDGDGNVYFLGRENTGSNTPIRYRKWVRATTTFESAIEIDATGGTAPWVSAKRGYSNSRIEFIYTDGTSSPYSVTYGAITINTAPNVPTDVIRTGLGTDNTPNFSAQVSDPDTGDQIKARFRVVTDAEVLVGTIDSSFRAGDGTVTAEYASALSSGLYKVQAKSIDGAGEESAYSAYTDFAITQNVSPITNVLVWNTKQADIKQVDLLWNVTLGNQRTWDLVWNIKAFSSKNAELLWRNKTPWTRKTYNEDNWTRVYT